MLTFNKHQNGLIVEVPDFDTCEIVRALAPTSEEIEFLGNKLNIPEDFLVAALDRDERPRIEVDEGCRLLIVRIPHHSASSDTPYVTIALAFILTPTHIVSVCSEESLLWRDLLTTGRRQRLPPPGERVAFLCAMFMMIARQYLVSIRKIKEEADAAEEAICGSMKNEMLIRMLHLEKCLVFFTTSLRANEPLWDRFRRIHGRELTEDELDLVDDVKIEFRQAQDLAKIYSNILSGMMNAFASVIANNLNVVMKLLTLITIILMLPTLIASIYGMNIKLPWQSSPHAFLIVMLLSISLSGLGIAVFVRKKWF
nr:magnesium transporter CorA family protein [Desulfobulbaceae bacterium]